jgi:hypothetical protein
MKNPNRYDTFIDNLTTEFSQIKNLQMMQDDETGQKLFNFIVKRIAEIHSFKSLFANYYLPAASKAVADDLNEINKSRYKHLLAVSREELKENYYETIRLGYIGMFHKYENYVTDLILHAELLATDEERRGLTLTKYVEQEFNYKIKDWKNSPTINRINWISNCNKHYDGYPTKEPKHPSYSHLPDNERMKLTKDDFVRDIQALISHYSSILQTVFLFASHKMTFEHMTFEINEFTDLDVHQKLLDGKKSMHETVLKVIELNKAI